MNNIIKNSFTKSTIVAWLPLAIAVTIVFGTINVTVQQSYRHGANDPQVQLAEDGSNILSQGVPIQQMASGMPRVDVTKSLATFVMFFGEDGKQVYSSGLIGNGTTSPVLPKGVLDAAKSASNGENRVTWQIPTGERFAAVVKHWSLGGQGGYLLVARSLREVEKNESSLTLMVGLAWIITLVLSLAAVSYKKISTMSDNGGTVL